MFPVGITAPKLSAPKVRVVLSGVPPIVTVPLGLTRNSDVPLELAISNSGAVEVAEPTIESKAKGVVVLIPMLPEL